MTEVADGREAYFATAMKAALAGDQAAYRELLQGVQAILKAYTRGILNRMGRYDEATRDDLVQEILLALHHKRQTYDQSQPFLPWLLAIARYKIIDHGRRERRRPFATAGELYDEALAAPVFQDAATAHDLQRLLATLPDKARRALELVRLEGLSNAEAAAATQASESAVKVSIHRSLKTLRARLARGPSHG